jgi:hypothetical protein
MKSFRGARIGDHLRYAYSGAGGINLPSAFPCDSVKRVISAAEPPDTLAPAQPPVWPNPGIIGPGEFTDAMQGLATDGKRWSFSASLRETPSRVSSHRTSDNSALCRLPSYRFQRRFGLRFLRPYLERRT